MSARTIAAFREQVRGEVVVPGEDGYDEARSVHNGMIDRRPGVVVRVANAGDVMATVTYARGRPSLTSRSEAAGTAPRGSGRMTTAWS